MTPSAPRTGADDGSDHQPNITATVVGKSARRTAARLTELQDLLGDHHDARVAFDWLRAAASDQADPEVAFVAGVIADRFVAEEHRMGNCWRSAWHRVRREM